MICSYCGAEIDKKRAYCLVCGTRQEPEKEAPQPEPVPEVLPAVQPLEETPAVPSPEEAFPRTRAVMEELFGPFDPAPGNEVSGAKNPELPVTQPEHEEPEQEEPEQEEPEQEAPEELPVSPRYSPAPLRQDVKPLPPLEEGGEIPEEKAGEDQPDGIRVQLPVGRSWVKMLLLGLITAGIYPTVIWSRIVTELNITASGNDGMRTMPYFAMMLLSPVTLFIYPFVWMHRFCRRVGAQLRFRNIGYRFGAKDFWLWCVLGRLILVGPLVFVHKLMKSMNFINANYNSCG